MYVFAMTTLVFWAGFMTHYVFDAPAEIEECRAMARQVYFYDPVTEAPAKGN